MKTRKKEMSSLHRITAILLVIFMLVVEIGTLVSCGPEPEEFEILFNVDGENYATIITPGTETIQIPENPSKDGYTFDGWYWDKDVWSKPFTANSLLDAPISSDMSVYAKFTPIPYSISYEMDGGAHNNPATYTIESSFEFANAQKAGYTFLASCIAISNSPSATITSQAPRITVTVASVVTCIRTVFGICASANRACSITVCYHTTPIFTN